MVIVGLGSGRSGTASLAKLLNAQPDSVCFHELNPTCVRFNGTPRPILNTISEFEAIVAGGDPSELTVDLARGPSIQTYERLCRMSRVRMIGDIAFYYLSYVESILERHPAVRFICLKRDKAETVDSWMRKTQVPRWRSKKIADRIGAWIMREPFRTERNPWMQHDGTKWAVDPVWDKCYPKFAGPTREAAVGQYWDYYYETAEPLVDKYPDNFRVVRTETLNEPEVQESLLDFVGFPREDRVRVDAHIHNYKR